MPLTVPQIINIAKISQYLAAQDVAKGSLFGTRITPDTPKILYMERKAVEWLYDLDPTNTSLTGTANYLYSLCRGYNLAAAYISGSGGGVTPVTPVTNIKSPIRITSSNFADATNWNGDNSDSIAILSTYTLEVYANFVTKFLEEGTEWERTTAGVNILIPGFDSQTNNYEFYIFISVQ